MNTNYGGETPLQHEMRTRQLALWNEEQAALAVLKPRYTMDMAHHYHAAVKQCKEAYGLLQRALEDEIRQKYGLLGLPWRKLQ